MTRRARACLAEALGRAERPAGRLRARGTGGRGARVVARSFSAQLEGLCGRLAGAGEIPLPTLRRVLTELLAHFPVYRTYGAGGAVLERAGGAGIGSAPARAVLQHAAEGARKTCLATDRWAVDPVPAPAGDLLSGDGAWALVRFQQLSAPVAAKARRGHGLLSLRPACCSRQ